MTRTGVPLNWNMSPFRFYKRETCLEVVNGTWGTLSVWEPKLDWSSRERTSRPGSCKSCGKLTKWINDYNSAGLSLGSTWRVTLINFSVIKNPANTVLYLIFYKLMRAFQQKVTTILQTSTTKESWENQQFSEELLQVKGWVAGRGREASSRLRSVNLQMYWGASVNDEITLCQFR